jgi:hypothetical protein
MKKILSEFVMLTAELGKQQSGKYAGYRAINFWDLMPSVVEYLVDLPEDGNGSPSETFLFLFRQRMML